MSILKELLIVPEKMDDEERCLLPICVVTIQITRRNHDGNTCCGLNALYSAAEESIEEQKWTSTVPFTLRVKRSDGQYCVRPDLVDKDGFLHYTEETAELFESWGDNRSSLL